MSGDNHDLYHVTPFKNYFIVFGSLLALTLITVVASRMDFGSMNAVIAMFIATIKASLVMLFFMHLKYDNLTNRVIFGTGFFFLLVLLTTTMTDYYTRINWTPK